MYKWIVGNAQALVVTLNKHDITLNQRAASHFEDARYVMVGLDDQTRKLAIKPVSKHEIDLKLVQIDQLHRISIGKGYAKINNKAACDLISSLINKPLDAIKVIAHYDENEQLLVVDLASLEER